MQITLPTEQETIISVLGFEEAYRSSTKVRINDNPNLDIKIPSIPGLSIMKLISWEDKYPERKRDAQDLFFIIKNCDHKDLQDRLYDKEATLLNEEDFDLSLASIRLLGRDIAKISNEKALKRIKQILTDATTDTATKLILDMYNTIYEDSDEILILLQKLKQGAFDK